MGLSYLTLVLNNKQKQINLDYINFFETNKYNIKKINITDKTNELMLIERKF